jgi:Methyltransferase domain
VILLFDVLEHLGDEDGFVEAIRFHLSPTGTVLLNVPALDLLWSKYDQAQGHFRRYNIATLKQVAQRNGMTVRTWTYWGLPLVPLLLVRKLWLLGQPDDKVIAAGFANPSDVINRVLVSLSRWEPTPQHWIGSSLMAVLSHANGS